MSCRWGGQKKRFAFFGCEGRCVMKQKERIGKKKHQIEGEAEAELSKIDTATTCVCDNELERSISMSWH